MTNQTPKPSGIYSEGMDEYHDIRTVLAVDPSREDDVNDLSLRLSFPIGGAKEYAFPYLTFESGGEALATLDLPAETAQKIYDLLTAQLARNEVIEALAGKRLTLAAYAQMCERPIIVIGPDDFACCPKTGARLEPHFTGPKLVEVDKDDDGPIYAGKSPTSGWYRYQVVADTEGEEDESPISALMQFSQGGG